jgi:Rps23 Pro-64 3,4-dihydroxylase Tpa1-like proline 4-hydroxylase
MDIKLYNDFLNLEQWQYAVQQTVQGRTWEFSGFSNTDKTEPKFWYMDLDNDSFFVDTMFSKICDVTGKKFALERVYANGQTHGLSGNLHQDQIGGNGEYHTFLYYPGPFWNPTWGGYTVFHNPVDDTIYSQYPTPNSAVLFNSEILHAGLEPTRHCTDLRVTIAFKMRLDPQ